MLFRSPSLRRPLEEWEERERSREGEESLALLVAETGKARRELVGVYDCPSYLPARNAKCFPCAAEDDGPVPHAGQRGDADVLFALPKHLREREGGTFVRACVRVCMCGVCA